MGNSCRTTGDEKILAVVGLGNPGKRVREFTAQRRVRGPRPVDSALRDRLNRNASSGPPGGAGMAEGRKVLFVKPLTYMNREWGSGRRNPEVLRYFRRAGARRSRRPRPAVCPHTHCRKRRSGRTPRNPVHNRPLGHKRFPAPQNGNRPPEAWRADRVLRPPASLFRRPRRI